jgi:hypothetical protein
MLLRKKVIISIPIPNRFMNGKEEFEYGFA